MDLILTAVVEMAQPFRMLMLVTGVFVGLVVGVVPGIGGLFAMALLIPMTYNMDAYAAFALLLGMGSVNTTSDTIPAILFGVPGSVERRRRCSTAMPWPRKAKPRAPSAPPIRRR